MRLLVAPTATSDPTAGGFAANAGPSAALAALLASVAALIAVGGHAVTERYTLHFVAVSATMVLAITAAASLTRAGFRREDRRAVVVGTAFSAMAALLLIHALATPDILLADENGLLGFAGGATLPVGAVILCLVGRPALRAPGAVRRLLALQALLVVGVLTIGGVGLLFPDLVPTEPEPRSPVALALLVVSSVFFAVLLRRVGRTYRLTRRAADLWVVLGVGWLAVALFASLVADPWSPAWWGSHVLETMGMLAFGVPVALDLHRDVPSHVISGGPGAEELVAHEEALLGPHVRSIMVRLAEKDASTEQHTRRVALLAVHLGEELGLSAGQLRRLAVGALLHDIGKLQVAGAILAKPTELTEDEFAVIRRHPHWGDELASELGFDAHARRLVRSHHERLDGAGYPDGLTGEQLGLDTRLLTVCDVYDALVSDRVYRAALTPAEALALMSRDAGTALDPRCLEALARLVGEAPHAAAPLARVPVTS